MNGGDSDGKGMAGGSYVPTSAAQMRAKIDKTGPEEAKRRLLAGLRDPTPSAESMEKARVSPRTPRDTREAGLLAAYVALGRKIRHDSTIGRDIFGLELGMLAVQDLLRAERIRSERAKPRRKK